MSQLVWDKQGEKLYETGVSKGIFYPFDSTTNAYTKGIAWNGLTNVSENPEGGEPNPFYADNKKYLNIFSVEEFKASITAYMYPDEFAECDGSKTAVKGVKIGQQKRKTFGLSYRTEIGSDTDGTKHGYKIHFVYGCTVTPSSKEYGTINDSPEPIEFSWDLDSIPVPVTKIPDCDDTSSVVVDSTDYTTEAEKALLKAFENYIYGTNATPAVYMLTTDTTVNPAKTYYTRSGSEGSYTYSPVTNPTDDNLGTYFEKISEEIPDAEPAALPLPDEIITRLTPPVVLKKNNNKLGHNFNNFKK